VLSRKVAHGGLPLHQLTRTGTHVAMIVLQHLLGGTSPVHTRTVIHLASFATLRLWIVVVLMTAPN
jgi:hypothetical protein